MSQIVDSTADKPQALFYCPDRDFLVPYIGRALPTHHILTDIEDADGVEVAIMISDTSVYDVTKGRNYAEDAPLNNDSRMLGLEQRFIDFCKSHGLAPTILRCANIIGTGMTGLPIELARRIMRGTLAHIRGNEARLSTVHATDVARVGALLAGRDVTVNITDGTDPTFDALIDALAVRINNKQVFVTSPKWARILYPYSVRTCTTTLTFSNVRMMSLLDECGAQAPTPVTEYLTTHIYDDESL